MTLPSGIFTSPISTSGLYLFNIFSNTSILNIIISGISTAQLFEDDYLYIYRNSRGLLKYDGDLTVVGGFTNNICRTASDYAITFTDTTYPTSSSIVKYKQLPLTSSGWTTAVTIPNLVSADALSDEGDAPMLDLPVLVGNSKIGSSIIIYSDDTNVPPFSPFIKSDYGILSGISIYKITDLEATA